MWYSEAIPLGRKIVPDLWLEVFILGYNFVGEIH